ncbi:MAG: AlpA family transcriptional regulator [Rhodoferax sp.]|nr:AlpA family transcriptional regulator [Rhodoferax sp.]
MQLVKNGTPPNEPNTQTAPSTVKDRYLRLPDVEQQTGCKKSTVYGLMAAGKFPKNVKLTRRLSVWRESEIQQWIAGQSA